MTMTNLGRASEMPPGSATPRQFGIDAGRIVMAFLVITLHSSPSLGSASIIGMMCRCAVPFFFVASGYFMKMPKRLTKDIVIRPLIRLLPVYIVWMSVYYMVAYVTNYAPLKIDYMSLLSGGTAYHLWYLPALGFAIVMVPLALLMLGVRATGAICMTLAITAIAFNTYHDILHLPGSPRRGGTMIAPLFVFIGYCIARYRTSPSVSVAAALMVVSFVVLLGEEIFISRRLGVEIQNHDFLFSTISFGVGVFLFARALSESPAIVRFAAFGRYSLGIYVSHVLFLWCLNVLLSQTIAPLWRVPLCFSCALMLTVVLLKVPFIKRTVS